MVSAKKKEVLRKLDFESQQQTYGFKRLFSSIDIISQKQIVCLRRKSTVLKETQQIKVLPMYVT